MQILALVMQPQMKTAGTGLEQNTVEKLYYVGATILIRLFDIESSIEARVVCELFPNSRFLKAWPALLLAICPKALLSTNQWWSHGAARHQTTTVTNAEYGFSAHNKPCFINSFNWLRANFLLALSQLNSARCITPQAHVERGLAGREEREREVFKKGRLPCHLTEITRNSFYLFTIRIKNWK